VTTEDGTSRASDRSPISRRLRSTRDRVGWTREALAYHSGVSWSAIAQIESGRRPSPRPETLWALAQALGVTVDYLLGGTGAASLLVHRALIYGSGEEFAAAVVPFVSTAAGRGDAALVVTSDVNAELVRSGLGPAASDVAFMDHQELYGSPLGAIARFRAFADERTASGASWVGVVGEPVWTGRDDDDVRRWATYESMFNLLFEGSPLTVLCPYDARSVDERILRIARETHPVLMRGTSTEPNDAFVDPAAFVLQGGA
jgi:transcriptional regulator with XRE-family HTH domain